MRPFVGLPPSLPLERSQPEVPSMTTMRTTSDETLALAANTKQAGRFFPAIEPGVLDIHATPFFRTVTVNTRLLAALVVTAGARGFEGLLAR